MPEDAIHGHGHSISDALNNAGVVAPDGSTQNIMMNGADDTVSVTLKCRRHDSHDQPL
jgi:hypothetical protein